MSRMTNDMYTVGYNTYVGRCARVIIVTVTANFLRQFHEMYRNVRYVITTPIPNKVV